MIANQSTEEVPVQVRESDSEYDFSFVELMLYGASTMMHAHLIKSMDIFGCGFFQTAGMTEASPALTFLRPEDHVVDCPAHLVRKLGRRGRRQS
jgi:acyl-CoA synthetase (AMP-forming)/AMP-acid ligase II